MKPYEKLLRIQDHLNDVSRNMDDCTLAETALLNTAYNAVQWLLDSIAERHEED